MRNIVIIVNGWRVKQKKERLSGNQYYEVSAKNMVSATFSDYSDAVQYATEKPPFHLRQIKAR